MRRPIEGGDPKKQFSYLEDVEFVFTQEYTKMLKPIFYKDFDYDAKEENGTITFILTPKTSTPTTQGDSNPK